MEFFVWFLFKMSSLLDFFSKFTKFIKQFSHYTSPFSKIRKHVFCMSQNYFTFCKLISSILVSLFLDAEEDWQDRISTGFDRLVAFASTELDKRRRSTEGVNTSPDSGLGSDSVVLGQPPTAPSPDEALGPPRTPSPGSPHPTNIPNGGHHNTSVPLKYQRHPDPERHHFKKKFYHRDWNNTTNSNPGSSKFRPKGKDWDWNQSAHWPPSDEQS